MIERFRDRLKQFVDDRRYWYTLFLGVCFLVINIWMLHGSGEYGGIAILIKGILPIIMTGFIVFLEDVFNIFLVLKIVICYLIYQALSYLVVMSLSINNPDFIWNDWVNNDWLQTSYVGPLLYFLLLLIIAFIFAFERKGQFQIDMDLSYREDFVVSQFLLAFILSDDKTQVFLTRNDNNLVYEMFLWLTLYIFLSFLLYEISRGWTIIFCNKSGFSAAVSMSTLLALIFNYSVQVGIDNKGSVLDSFIFPGAFLFQVICYSLLFLGIYLLLNSFPVSTLIIIGVGSIFSLANILKFSMRYEPVLPSDLEWLQQLGLLLGFVDKNLVIQVSFSLLALCLLTYFGHKFLWRGPIIANYYLRFGMLTLILSFFVFIANTIRDYDKNSSQVPIISQLEKKNSINWMGNTVNAKMKSLTYVWFKQLVTSAMDKPEGYSREKIEELENKYSLLADEINVDRHQFINQQTVIFLLSESYSDPSRLPGIKLSDEATPYLKSLMPQYTSGLMQSDGYGGGTANMEFQTLTGLPMYNMSSNISTIYTEVALKMPYIPTISDLFSKDSRYAVHLASALNYSRSAIYRKMAYNEFIALSNTDFLAEHVDKEGNYPSDQATYQNVLDKLTPDSPQFFSVMTMQNHSPWWSPQPEHLTVTAEGYTEEENANLTNYVRLLSITDKATQAFFDELSQFDKKITVVFYGDHLPGLYRNDQFDGNDELRYQTDYLIWSNYPTIKQEYTMLNSSDFIAALLETTDSKVSPYQALLTEVMKYASVDKSELSERGYEVANDLRLIEYDLVSGKGYLKQDSEFFKVGD